MSVQFREFKTWKFSLYISNLSCHRIPLGGFSYDATVFPTTCTDIVTTTWLMAPVAFTCKLNLRVRFHTQALDNSRDDPVRATPLVCPWSQLKDYISDRFCYFQVGQMNRTWQHSTVDMAYILSIVYLTVRRGSAKFDFSFLCITLNSGFIRYVHHTRKPGSSLPPEISQVSLWKEKDRQGNVGMF